MKSKTPPGWLTSLFAMVAAADPLSAQTVVPRANDPVVELSPFVVNSSKDTGYQAMSTLAGTRLDTPLKDLGAAISVYTKGFLDDIGATSGNDFLIYATSQEAAGPGGNFPNAARGGNDLGSTGGPNSDSHRNEPQGAIRSRGLIAATLTRDFYATRIPTDTYNTDRMTVLRGPNAALFGVGSPGGVVDTSLVRANLQSNTNKVAFRLDNNGGTRSTVDFNRVLIPDKLAARLAGVQMRDEYNQRPAYEEKERIYGTMAYKPFQSTALRANFESGRHTANRPNMIPPANNMVVDWLNNGRPGFDWTFYDDPVRNPFAPVQNASNLVPYYMVNRGNFGSEGIFYANPDDTNYSYAIRPSTPNTATNVADSVRNQLFHPLLNRDLAADGMFYTTVANIIDIPAAAYWVGGNVLPGQLASQIPPGLKPQNFTDFSAFDWKNRMLDESSLYTFNFHSANVTLEQRGWENRVGVEFAFDKQYFENKARLSFFSGGQSNNQILIDTTITLPNGLPNPNLGRPFAHVIAGTSQFHQYVESETRRVSAYLKYDFKDLNSSWGKWLGSHTLSGLVERFRNDSISIQYIFRPDGPLAQSITPSIVSRAPPAFSVYMGPSIIGNNNPLRLNPIKVPRFAPGPIGTISSYIRPADETSLGAFQDTPLSLVYVNQNSSATRDLIESKAVTLQSYWLENLVTVLGWRRDADFNISRNITSVSNPTRPNDPGKTVWGMEDLSFPNEPPPTIAAEVKSYSVVLRWPEKLFKLPRGMDFGVFYNNSENFTPVGNRVTGWGQVLPPPQGKTKEYGLNFSAFNEKLTIRLNRYENTVKNNSGGGSASGRIYLLPTDAITRWAVEGNVNPHLVAMRQADIALLKSVLPVPNYTDLWALTVTGVAPNIIATRTNLPFNDDLSDLVGKGEELDIIFNPTPNWRILANVAHQEVKRSKINQFGKILFAQMMPVIQQLSGRSFGTYPVGWQIGDPLPANFETFGAFVDRTITLQLAIDNLNEGVPTSEQRPWRFNVVTNYRFGSGSIFGEKLKGWSVGGGVRWEDKYIMGYPSGRLANTQPTFDKANPWRSPVTMNIDAFFGYERKVWDNRIDWKLQVNVTNLYQSRALIPVQVQPWGQPSSMILAPERRWYLSNSFSF